MAVNVPHELAALQRLSAQQLQVRYAEVFGETTRAHNKPWLIRRILWRLQALAEGDLSERARQRAAELANDADLRLYPPRTPTTVAQQPPPAPTVVPPRDERLPPPGTVLARPYRGETLQVRVLEDGFEFRGQVYQSLSAVAKTITGSHCNGFHFFRLALHGGKP
jgi:hypothetical protein